MPLSDEKRNVVSSFSQSPLIRYLSNLQVLREHLKAQMSSKLGRVGLLPAFNIYVDCLMYN